MGPSRFVYPIVLIALWAAIFAAAITRPALLDDADSIHAEAVREMVQSGDWVTLRIDNGIRYLEKAPLMYWLAALSVSAFGLHDWAIRLPASIFSLLLIFLVFRFGTRFWGEKGGFYSGIVISACLGHYAFTRIFLPDVMVTFFIPLCLYLYTLIIIEGIEPKRIGPIDLRCAGFFISAALAVLSKGLIGLIFTGAIIFFHILVTGNWKTLRRLQIGYGIVIFLIVAAPWHVAAALANSDFLWFYFIREHVLRYLGMRYPRDSGSVPRLLFWGLHLLWLFPWSAFIWRLVRNFPRSIHPQEMPERVTLFLFIWIGVILAFFTFGASLEYYTFPTFAAFALLFGKAMSDLDTRQTTPKGGLIGLGVMAALSLSTGVSMIALAWWGNHTAQLKTLSSTLSTHPEHYDLAFGHMTDLTSATLSHLAPLVYKTAALLIAGPSIAFVFAIRNRWMASFLLLAAMMVGVCHLCNDGLCAFEPVMGSRNLAEVINENYRPGDKIVINDFYEKGSTLNYYTGRQVYVLNGGVGVLWYGLQDKTAPKLWLTEDGLLKEWESGERIFLFTEEQPLESFLGRHHDFKYRILAENGGKKILINW
ncbi:putative Glycosyl transferase family 39 [Syntrophobacter sp. SbD1]|nr:putative Glycosyl transferase family 39 [Syntrophobacter sp. SbD1]